MEDNKTEKEIEETLPPEQEQETAAEPVAAEKIEATKENETPKKTEEKPKKQKKKMKKSTKIILICVSIFLGLLLAALITAVIWGKTLLAKIPRFGDNEPTLSFEEALKLREETDPVDENFTGPSYNGEDVDMPEDSAEMIKKNKNIVNIMLVGQDRREGQGRQRSDAMILCTINKETKKLTMTSFMRDLWVRIPGYYDERLNVPYAIGGFKLLNKTMAYQYGVNVDYSVEVDFTGFESVVNKLGGVTISLTAAEASTLNKGTNWGLSAGTNTLNGEQALAYSRIRKIDSDFVRTSRQRTVLMAVFNKMKTKSVTELYDIMLDILPLVKTDMTDSEIVDLLFSVGPMLSELDTTAQRIPLDGTYEHAMIDGKAVLFLNPTNLEKNRKFLKESLTK